MSAAENGFREWAILELMGHRRLAGLVTEATIGGGAFIRIDVPGKDGTTVTQFYSPSSVYALTPVAEGVARAVAANSQPEPVTRWDMAAPALPAAPARRSEYEDEDDDL